MFSVFEPAAPAGEPAMTTISAAAMPNQAAGAITREEWMKAAAASLGGKDDDEKEKAQPAWIDALGTEVFGDGDGDADEDRAGLPLSVDDVSKFMVGAAMPLPAVAMAPAGTSAATSPTAGMPAPMHSQHHLGQQFAAMSAVPRQHAARQVPEPSPAYAPPPGAIAPGPWAANRRGVSNGSNKGLVPADPVENGGGCSAYCKIGGAGDTILGEVMERLGLGEVWASDGQADLASYYSVKNNKMTKIIAHMRNVWVFVGLFVLIMLALIPVWNSDRLLKDPAYIYYAGKTVPRAILSVCLSLPVFYVCAVSLIFKKGSLKAITEQTMLGVGVVFLMLLGFSLLLLSVPMNLYSERTYNDIIYACTSGENTRELYQTAQALQVLRQEPACAAELTVMNCAGFQSTPYTEVLQAMEIHYHCSGYCYDPDSFEQPAASSSTQALTRKIQGSSLMQTSSVMQTHTYAKHKHRHYVHGAGRHDRASPTEDGTSVPMGVSSPLQPKKIRLGRRDAHEEVLASRQRLSRSTRMKFDKFSSGSSAAQPLIPEEIAGQTLVYALHLENTTNFTGAGPPPHPPTLFSLANWKASCDGMAANNMGHMLNDVSSQAFYQGLMLMTVSLSVGFLQLVGMCASPVPK